ncbi:ATP-dependent helicase [bacterium]|nr:MAG: ATP-dependent helicase [bacterium]
MTFAAGSIVRARGREWVVQPGAAPDWLVLRPLGGTDREVTGLYLPLEGDDVAPASFALPDPERAGDAFGAELLRDAARLSLRASTGPFRSFARVAVEPRPYQLVPLLLALRQAVVRLLIADDVGIGKTIEAGLVARELLDRGEIARLAVLCPPHLAEQWQRELSDKLGIEAALVLTSTVARLERDCAVGQSLFELHPFVVVSADYIKSPRRRDEFVRTCPELVIVDEAHTCAATPQRAGGGQHQRHALVRRLAEDARRHLVLVTATPHSGDEGAFRSLLALLAPAFADLPADLSGREHEGARRAVARHLVQRRRVDIRRYLDAETVFPRRLEAEVAYTLTEPYRALLDQALAYARERVADPSGDARRRRVRWWSALALLRSLASSPAAAAATLRSRSSAVDAADAGEADEIGARAVLDLDVGDAGDFVDAIPGGQDGDDAESEAPHRRRLLRMAAAADDLHGPQRDAKLAAAVKLVRELAAEGCQPIVFCRFIPTAEYVAGALRSALRGVEVAAVTGVLPAAEREQRVAALGLAERRVLVCTDCLSEGVNLQDHFDAVIHYDLAWNPTIHEQREGRVDRYGQPKPDVRAVTMYGKDNRIDGLVLEVLLRKHKVIRHSLGVAVNVPASTGELMQALMHGLILRGGDVDPRQMALFDLAGAAFGDLHARWEDAAEREAVSRTLFAHHTVDVADVRREWEAVRAAIGTGEDVRRFVGAAVAAHGGTAAARGRLVDLSLPAHRTGLLDAVRAGGALEDRFSACFDLPVPDGAVYLGRTHPVVEGLAAYVLDTALDPLAGGVAARCGAIRTRAVDKRTTLLLLRGRYQIVPPGGRPEQALLAEECRVAAFRGAPDAAEWLGDAEAEALLAAEPHANVAPEQARGFVRAVVAGFGALAGALDRQAEDRAAALAAAHERVRAAVRPGAGAGAVGVVPHLPVDVLGLYVLLPV